MKAKVSVVFIPPYIILFNIIGRYCVSHMTSRRKRILNSTITSVASKGVSIGAMVLLVSMAHSAILPEALGVWLTLTSLLLILQFADFGIGNGLVTIIISSQGAEGRQKIAEAVSAGLFLTSILAIIIVFFSAALIPFLDWKVAFKLDNLSNHEVSTALVVFAICLALTIPATISQKILWGFQEMYLANIWQMAGAMMQLVFMALAIKLDLGLWAFVLAVPGGVLFALIASCFNEWFRRRVWLKPRISHINKVMIRRLITNGGSWFVTQLALFAAVAMDGVFVTWIFGAEAMVSYGLMMRLMSGLAIALFFTMPLWPAFAEALEKQDNIWLINTFKRALALCCGIGLIAAAIILFFSKEIIEVWIGTDVVIQKNLIYSFALWAFVYNVWCAVAALLSNEILMKHMVFVVLIGSSIALILKVPLANNYGSAGICWATSIGLGVSCLVGLLAIYKELRNRMVDA